LKWIFQGWLDPGRLQWAEDEETKISLWDCGVEKNTANLSLPDGEGRTAIMNHVRLRRTVRPLP